MFAGKTEEEVESTGKPYGLSPGDLVAMHHRHLPVFGVFMPPSQDMEGDVDYDLPRLKTLLGEVHLFGRIWELGVLKSTHVESTCTKNGILAGKCMEEYADFTATLSEKADRLLHDLVFQSRKSPYLLASQLRGMITSPSVIDSPAFSYYTSIASAQTSVADDDSPTWTTHAQDDVLVPCLSFEWKCDPDKSTRISEHKKGEEVVSALGYSFQVPVSGVIAVYNRNFPSLRRSTSWALQMIAEESVLSGLPDDGIKSGLLASKGLFFSIPNLVRRSTELASKVNQWAGDETARFTVKLGPDTITVENTYELMITTKLKAAIHDCFTSHPLESFTNISTLMKIDTLGALYYFFFGHFKESGAALCGRNGAVSATPAKPSEQTQHQNQHQSQQQNQNQSQHHPALMENDRLSAIDDEQVPPAIDDAKRASERESSPVSYIITSIKRGFSSTIRDSNNDTYCKAKSSFSSGSKDGVSVVLGKSTSVTLHKKPRLEVASSSTNCDELTTHLPSSSIDCKSFKMEVQAILDLEQSHERDRLVSALINKWKEICRKEVQSEYASILDFAKKKKISGQSNCFSGINTSGMSKSQIAQHWREVAASISTSTARHHVRLQTWQNLNTAYRAWQSLQELCKEVVGLYILTHENTATRMTSPQEKIQALRRIVSERHLEYSPALIELLIWLAGLAQMTQEEFAKDDEQFGRPYQISSLRLQGLSRKRRSVTTDFTLSASVSISDHAGSISDHAESLMIVATTKTDHAGAIEDELSVLWASTGPGRDSTNNDDSRYHTLIFESLLQILYPSVVDLLSSTDVCGKAVGSSKRSSWPCRRRIMQFRMELLELMASIKRPGIQDGPPLSTDVFAFSTVATIILAPARIFPFPKTRKEEREGTRGNFFFRYEGTYQAPLMIRRYSGEYSSALTAEATKVIMDAVKEVIAHSADEITLLAQEYSRLSLSSSSSR
ncbi:hypothetical protein CBS101457_000082 [Exobasidium rhododendri]|nr:hypothetical protein CBS101457_000082 [Exobasidium rhododendri]